jgi:Mg2+-importing ATPase
MTMPSDLAVAQSAVSAKKGAGTMRVSAQLVDAAPLPAADALERLGTRIQGLTADEAAQRLERFGPNTVGTEKGMSCWHILFKACVNPLVILLLGLSVVM